LLQRVALLEVQKFFEGKYGTPEEVAKVDTKMPATAVQQNVEKETGQIVEGSFGIMTVV